MRNLAATGDQGQDIQRQRRWDEIRGRSPNNIKRRGQVGQRQQTAAGPSASGTGPEEKKGMGMGNGKGRDRLEQGSGRQNEKNWIVLDGQGGVMSRVRILRLTLVSFLFLFLFLFLSVSSVIDLSPSFTPLYYYDYYPLAIPYRCRGPPAVANLPMAPCLDGVDSCLDCES